jgi:hypothetical protein
MMRKIVEILMVFFLWTAGLTLSAHMLLPHDHHISEFYSHEDESCPASDENSRHKPAFPVHCQAFNDLTSEKPRAVYFSQDSENDLVAFHSLPCTNTFVLQSCSERIVYLLIPVFDSHTDESALLRGPPALS